ncbi:DEAD/DEAH box helicase [Sulfurovum sp. NBC37-1]|uniref:DEAD/DEAH box helicase n=1 Tax=Sulfurovum sp. (strain NBC37-1) TaxID=387093 RepID=UPI00130516E2|nr:DEAD/DEAH box helicase [Sulfurovum sp. NBC37-1]
MFEKQKSDIENNIIAIKKEIERLSPFSKSDKIKLFRKLFIGNELVYAKHWISKDGLKKGYSPVSKTFKGTDYIPVNDHVIQQHLEGKVRMGTYAVKNQTLCSFLAIDLDKSSFVADARAIHTVCNAMDINAYFELSKSGNGIHIWFFFLEDVRARDARILGDLIITKAMDISDGIDMKSYDRLFPNQDYVAPDALGNLIALPLHFGSRSEGKTVFIDIDTMQPYENQWSILQNVLKISSQKLHSLIIDYARLTESTSLMPWEIKQEKLVLPKAVQMVLHNAIYIEKSVLSITLLNLLKRMASFYNPEFFMRQRQRLSTFNTPRVVSTYDLNERYIILPRGLYGKLKSFFKKHKVQMHIEDKRLNMKIPAQEFFLDLRSEQIKAKNEILKNDYSLLIAPPGFGKTAVASAVISEHGVATLILVHKTVLLEQWSKRLSEYFKIDIKSIGILGKGKKKLNGNLDVATLQSLKNRPELIENYSQIIIDEAHHMPAVSFEIPLKRFKGKYVLGLSATPKRKDGMEAIMYLQCGDIVHESVRESTVKHTLKTVTTQYDTFMDHFSMMLGEITEDDMRNRQIVDEIVKLSERKILVLSERIEHLNILWHMLEARGIDAVLLYGGLKTKEKRLQFEKTEDASIILSTSSYIGEGIDIGHLDTIIFTMPISYPERIIQYLGRIGRQGQQCLAIDFIDISVPMLKSSFNKRMRGYKKMGYVLAPVQTLFETV